MTEATAIAIPITIVGVSGSPKATVPTKIAVMGSNTPNTEAFVAPILRVATARVAVDIIVGRTASQSSDSHAFTPLMPLVRGTSEIRVPIQKTTEPTKSV